MRCTNKRIIVLKTMVFLVGFCLIFHLLYAFLLEKNPYGKYRNYKVQDNVDVLILGSSHADNGIDAKMISDTVNSENGANINVFNYAVYGMRMEQMYYFAKEILKEKKPDMIILETFAFVPIADEDREILARRAFDPFPRTKNIIDGINYCVKDELWSYYIPFIKYHTRWKELRNTDVEMVFESSYWENSGFTTRPNNQFMEEEDDFFEENLSDITELREITASEKECLDCFLKMTEEKGIKVLFVSVPFKAQLGMYSPEMVKINNYLDEYYSEGDMVRMLDMNRLWKELDFGYADLYNEGHCNDSGKAKVTNYIAEYLLSMYEVKEWEGLKA